MNRYVSAPTNRGSDIICTANLTFKTDSASPPGPC